MNIVKIFVGTVHCFWIAGSSSGGVEPEETRSHPVGRRPGPGGSSGGVRTVESDAAKGSDPSGEHGPEGLQAEMRMMAARRQSLSSIAVR